MCYYLFSEGVKYYILLCYVKYGETLNFALDKQIERLIEVLALSALLKEETITPKKTIYKLKLKEFVYPEEINLE